MSQLAQRHAHPTDMGNLLRSILQGRLQTPADQLEKVSPYQFFSQTIENVRTDRYLLFKTSVCQPERPSSQPNLLSFGSTSLTGGQAGACRRVSVYARKSEKAALRGPQDIEAAGRKAAVASAAAVVASPSTYKCGSRKGAGQFQCNREPRKS